MRKFVSISSLAAVMLSAALCPVSPARAAEDLTGLVHSLKQGGYALVVRHGATSSAQSDVYPLDYNDMTRQRQLSDEGRDTARQVGAAFAKLGIPIGAVYSSRLNRAVETAKLISRKEVVPKEELNDSGMGSASAMAGNAGGGSASHGRALKALAAQAPMPGTNTLIVTHKTNIQDAFGKDWADVREGETSVFKIDGDGGLTPVARVQAGQWVAAAQNTVN